MKNQEQSGIEPQGQATRFSNENCTTEPCMITVVFKMILTSEDSLFSHGVSSNQSYEILQIFQKDLNGVSHCLTPKK